MSGKKRLRKNRAIRRVIEIRKLYAKRLSEQNTREETVKSSYNELYVVILMVMLFVTMVLAELFILQ